MNTVIGSSSYGDFKGALVFSEDLSQRSPALWWQEEKCVILLHASKCFDIDPKTGTSLHLFYTAE